MTFIVGSDGVVYQRDLGQATDVIARSMRAYNPDDAWKKAEDTSGSAAPQPMGR
jgi:hypothetical protein